MVRLEKQHLIKRYIFGDFFAIIITDKNMTFFGILTIHGVKNATGGLSSKAAPEKLFVHTFIFM